MGPVGTGDWELGLGLDNNDIVMMMILMIMMMAAPQERGHHDCRQGAENEIQEAGGGSRNRQTKSQRQGAVIFTMRADAEKSIVFHLQFTLT